MGMLTSKAPTLMPRQIAVTVEKDTREHDVHHI